MYPKICVRILWCNPVSKMNAKNIILNIEHAVVNIHERTNETKLTVNERQANQSKL